MVVEIKKNTSINEIKFILKSFKNRKGKKKSINSFFGKLPKIDDGLKYQKVFRNEWK